MSEMTRQPALVTDGRPEVSKSLARTGFFQEHQLNSENVPRRFGDFVRRYMATIGRATEGKPTPIGSGTFVKRTDGRPGILTAGHIIGAVKVKENIVVPPIQDCKDITFAGIEGQDMANHGKPKHWPMGPDDGGTPLSGEDAGRMESPGAVFDIRTNDRSAFHGPVQFGIVFGFVEAASDMNNKTVVAHAM